MTNPHHMAARVGSGVFADLDVSSLNCARSASRRPGGFFGR